MRPNVSICQIGVNGCQGPSALACMIFKETDAVPYSLSPVSIAPDVWVFAPHPDDEVFGCGGALALHVQQGAKVHVVFQSVTLLSCAVVFHNVSSAVVYVLPKSNTC